MRLKSMLKRIFPMPASTLKHELMRLAEQSQNNREAIQRLSELQTALQKQINELMEYNRQTVLRSYDSEIRREHLLKELLSRQQVLLDSLESEQSKQDQFWETQNKFLERLSQQMELLPQRFEVLSKKLDAASEAQANIYKTVQRTERTASEGVWATFLTTQFPGAASC